MKRYFVKYYADFANTYTLAYTVDKKQAVQSYKNGNVKITLGPDLKPDEP